MIYVSKHLEKQQNVLFLFNLNLENNSNTTPRYNFIFLEKLNMRGEGNGKYGWASPSMWRYGSAPFPSPTSNFFVYLSAQHFGVREWRCCIFHMETVTHLCFGKEYSMMTTFLWVFTTPYFHMSGGQGARAQGHRETHRLGRACCQLHPGDHSQHWSRRDWHQNA